MTDNFENAIAEIVRLRKYQNEKRSAKPYAILGYRGIVVGPPPLWDLPEYAGFWLTDSNGLLLNGTWDFRNASARQYYIADLLRNNNSTLTDGVFVDTGDVRPIFRVPLFGRSTSPLCMMHVPLRHCTCWYQYRTTS
jgi:hypothetical protein